MNISPTSLPPLKLDPEQISALKSLITQELEVERQLLAYLPRHVQSARRLMALERKRDSGAELDDGDLLAMEVAQDNLLGRYQGKQSRPVGLGIEPLPPMPMGKRDQQAAQLAYDGLEAFTRGMGLQALDEARRAAGQAPVSFELIEMQPPKPPPLVEIGFFATMKKAFKLWLESRRQRKAQLKAHRDLIKALTNQEKPLAKLNKTEAIYQAGLKGEYEALPEGEAKQHLAALEAALKEGKFDK